MSDLSNAHGALPLPGRGEGVGARRRFRRALWSLATLAVLALAAASAFVLALGPPPLGKDLEYSTLVLDREGRLLQPFATSDGRWRLPAQPDDVDPRYLDLLFAYEDRRF